MASFRDYDPSIPQCKDLNPYELYGKDGWVPQNVVIVDRMYYMYITIYMSFIFVLSVSGNSMVLYVVYKNKVRRRILRVFYYLHKLKNAILCFGESDTTLPFFET